MTRKPSKPAVRRERGYEIGNWVPHYGTIGAIVFTGGERYYMLHDRKGVVSLMPAKTIDDMKRSGPRRVGKGELV